MAYPTVSGPSGLVPVKLVSGVPFVGVTRQYSIASGYNTNIFNGDAVQLVTGGTVERDTADAAMTPIGVFLGCTYTDPTLGYQVFSQYYPANTVHLTSWLTSLMALMCCLKLLYFHPLLALRQ